MELELKELKKSYGDVHALRGISYKFSTGIYGILGANGAGKSTMINLITDNIIRDDDGGAVYYNGKEILQMGKEFRKKVGYMPQQQGFYEDFSPRTFLRYIAEIKGIRAKDAKMQTEELLLVVNLSKVADKKIGGFSGGMKQRVLLAQALLGKPDILILDEPTAGLDPKERIALRNYIAGLSKNKIILLATHVVSDIECIADRVLFIKKGRIVAEGTPEELINSMIGKVGEITCSLENVEGLQEKYRIGNIRQRKSGLVLRIAGDTLPADAVLVDNNIDLEDVYLYYFG